MADATTARHKCRAVCGDAVVYVGDTQGGDEGDGFGLKTVLKTDESMWTYVGEVEDFCWVIWDILDGTTPEN